MADPAEAEIPEAVPPKLLYRVCPPKALSFRSIGEFEPIEDGIGQERAARDPGIA